MLVGTPLIGFQRSPEIAEAVRAEQGRTAEFKQAVFQMGKVEHDPEFAPWKGAINGVIIDATVIFQEAVATRSACIAAGLVHSKSCDFALVREAKLLGWIGALAGFSDPHQIRPWNDEKTIRPQIDAWISNDFDVARLRIAHYAPSLSHFQVSISRASVLRDKALESARVNDWAGGLILLRHSQILMDDASVRALQEAYSK